MTNNAALAGIIEQANKLINFVPFKLPLLSSLLPQSSSSSDGYTIIKKQRLSWGAAITKQEQQLATTRANMKVPTVLSGFDVTHVNKITQGTFSLDHIKVL